MDGQYNKVMAYRLLSSSEHYSASGCLEVHAINLAHIEDWNQSLPVQVEHRIMLG